MGDDWILDVLSDLRRFAAGNDLPRLSEQLEETLCLAALELESRRGASSDRSNNVAPEAPVAPKRSHA